MSERKLTDCLNALVELDLCQVCAVLECLGGDVLDRERNKKEEKTMNSTITNKIIICLILCRQ